MIESNVGPSDPAGAETLETMAGAPRYNAWQFSAVQAYIGQRVCEIGSGVGTMSQYILASPRKIVVLTDPDAGYRALLRRCFAGRDQVVVESLALPDDEAAERMSRYRFDTVVALNVVEHIADDLGAMRSVFRLLPPGGKVVVLVPAVGAAYGSLDRELGHVRRYTRQRGAALLREAGFAIVAVRYFNFVGLLGWLINARILGAQRISRRQLRIFDSLVPLLRSERHVTLPVGQSLILIGRRP